MPLPRRCLARTSTKSTIEVVSADTEQIIGTVPEARDTDVDLAVSSARQAFDDPAGWAHGSPERRANAIEWLCAAISGEPANSCWRASGKG
ncbi:aldehyde dehydrogenase family protein [Amycolatopsis jiangsuensis]|uniref:aldehyde dehydrogenase family protein n=1 Tax=Amycolatopsis jiangsuensis TaxID=1181879 RepID=UPI0016125C7E